MHRTWTVSSPFANQWGFFANQTLISQLFLPFLLIQKLVCGSPSVLVHPLWQMACHWQQYAANPMLCSRVYKPLLILLACFVMGIHKPLNLGAEKVQLQALQHTARSIQIPVTS